MAVQRAAEIIEKAKNESDELIDSALAKVAQILDVTRYNAAKAGLSTSLAQLAKVDPGGYERRPTLLWLLWALLNVSFRLPLSKPHYSDATLSAVRVPRGTALSQLLSPVAEVTTRIGEVTGLAFRVFLLPTASRTWLNCDWLTSHQQVLHVATKDRTRLNRFQDAFSEQRCRLVVALPHVLHPSSGQLDSDLLSALIQDLVPNHGLTLDQVQKLAWETFDEFASQHRRESPSLAELYEMIRAESEVLPLAKPLALDGVIQVQPFYNDSPTTKGDGYGDGDVRAQRQLSDDRSDRARDASRQNARSRRSCGEHRDTSADGNASPVDGDVHERTSPCDDRRAVTAPTSTIEQASRALNDGDNDYLVFNDVDCGHPTVVYRRAGTAEHGVMRLGDIEPAVIEAVGEEAVQLLRASSSPRPDHVRTDGAAADTGAEYDEYIIIETIANPA